MVQAVFTCFNNQRLSILCLSWIIHVSHFLCNFVPLFPFPTVSTPAFWCRCFMSRIFSVPALAISYWHNTTPCIHHTSRDRDIESQDRDLVRPKSNNLVTYAYSSYYAQGVISPVLCSPLLFVVALVCFCQWAGRGFTVFTKQPIGRQKEIPAASYVRIVGLFLPTDVA